MNQNTKKTQEDKEHTEAVIICNTDNGASGFLNEPTYPVKNESDSGKPSESEEIIYDRMQGADTKNMIESDSFKTETIKSSLRSGENELSTITQEEENFARMSLLLSGVSHRAARTLFDFEFNVSTLAENLTKEYKKLNALRKQRIINSSQWKLLFPNDGCPNSRMFDLTLLITLLTNLTDVYQCNDQLPSRADTSPSADLSRMKYYRNQIAHKTEGKIESLFFSKAWDDIIQAVKRLGGQELFEECKTLKTKQLDVSTVPWNKRVQIKAILQKWESGLYSFVETRAAKKVLECVQANSCVTITAGSGVGKTATLHHVAFQMANEGYDVIPVTFPPEIVNFYNPKKKTLFVIDNLRGTYSLNHYDLECWETIIERVTVLIQNKLTKIVVACRLQVYQDQKFQILSIFSTCLCNLSSKDLCLSKTEKKSIAEAYLNTKASGIIQYCDLYDCFPLLCKLYPDYPDLDIDDFFKNPFVVYKVEIDKLRIGHFRKYCALALCAIFNNALKEEWLTDEIDDEKRETIENICEECRLDRGTSRLILLDELKSLENTFTKKDQNVYTILHDKLFDFMAFYFGKNMIQSLIRNASNVFIAQRFLLTETDDMDQFITVIPQQYHQIYLQRMIDDWSKGKLLSVFNNINIKIPEVRQRFLCYLNTLEISIQSKLAHTLDFVYKCTALEMCCMYDDISFIQWCICHDIDVNQCDSKDISPLHIAAYKGHANVVKILLDNNAEIDKGSDNGSTPLHVACLFNHKEVVKLLLEHKADINKCANNGDSPLHNACQQNHILISQELMGIKAYTEMCKSDGASSFFSYCRNNHIAVVKLLLENKADINKCTNNEESPLYIASQNNHIETVKVLLQNKADINKCKVGGESPLFGACTNNHIEVVKVLLDGKADINKSADDGKTPLYIACVDNHIDVVQLLLDYKADINKCRDNGTSPLIMACAENHTKVVKLLLDSKAAIDQGEKDGVTPLVTACWKNHIETVKILLDNKADINKCTDDGPSPMFVACQNNYIEIVKVLLDNKADLNMCMKGGLSSLFIACQNGHIEIVKILLENKADINKLTDDGISPLFAASINNHDSIVKLLFEKEDSTCILM